MAVWAVAALMVPHFLNQLDSLAGKIIVLKKALKGKRI